MFRDGPVLGWPQLKNGLSGTLTNSREWLVSRFR